MRNQKAPIIILCLLTIFVLGFFVYNQQGQWHWDEHYDADSKQPYGGSAIQEMLKTYHPNGKLEQLNGNISELLPRKNIKNQNYVFIGEKMFMDTADINTLFDFARAGNTVFISATSLPHKFMFDLNPGFCYGTNYWDDYESFKDTSVFSDFHHRDLKDAEGTGFEIPYFNDYRVATHEWFYIENKYFCDNVQHMVDLGHYTYKDRKLVNFAMAPIGEGRIFIHTTPLAFSNYLLKYERNLEYAEGLLSHLGSGKTYWDEYSRDFHFKKMAPARYDSNVDNVGPLSFVTAQASLAWAWYLGLGLALMHLIFRSKRKQRVIPVLAKNTNTSLEFVHTIGRLYYLQNNHKILSEQKMSLFLTYIRDHYHLPTHHLDQSFLNRLAQKSQIAAEDINRLFGLYRQIEGSTPAQVTEEVLIAFHLKMEYFYKNCK